MHKQRGAVLIVSLILLLLITAIAVSTISSSTFQTAMAANAQQRETILRAAESAAEQPLTDDILSKAYNAFLKWGGTKNESDRIYSVPEDKLKGDLPMEATVLHLGVANAEYFDPKQYKYYVYESRGLAHSADDDDSKKAKVSTQVVQGVAKLSPSGQAATYDPY
jgi:uncharacterized protein YycO